jgi:uncharacterized integral membrane protein
MAEIIIKRKSKRVWPWIVGILGILILAIILWLAFGNTNTTNRMGYLQSANQREVASKHLRYIPEVMITKLETYLA